MILCEFKYALDDNKKIVWPGLINSIAEYLV